MCGAGVECGVGGEGAEGAGGAVRRDPVPGKGPLGLRCGSHRIRARLLASITRIPMKSSFEDLRVFQAAMNLRVDLHRLTESFPKHELFGIVSQLRRAAGSVVRNIAEGHGRLTYGEWRLFLSQARGSLYEVEAELIASWRLEYIDEETFRAKQEQARAVGQMLSGLIRYVQRHDNRRPGRSSPRNG